MFKHLKNFLIATVLTFSFIGSINALDNTNDGFIVNGITINNELIDNIWSNIEGKTQHDFYPNYSDNTYVFHKENLPYMYIETNTSGSVLLFFSPTNEFLSWLSTNRIARINSDYVVRVEIYNGNYYYTFDRAIYTATYSGTNKAITNFDFFDNNNNLLLSKSFDYENKPTIFNFHLNGGHGTCVLGIDPPTPVIHILHDDENFSINTDDYDIYDVLDNLEIEKDNMIFDGFFYDPNFTQRFSTFDNFDDYATVIDDQKVINLYAKYRYKNVDDFLANVNFNEYTFDTNYDYAIINRGNNGDSVYMGLPFSNYELEVYEYQENTNSYKEGSSACLVPIFNKNKRYYYELNTLFTHNQEVLILPKQLFDQLDPNTFDDPGDTHKFYLTNNAYVTYTNDLTHVTITNSQGQQIDTNLQNSFELSQQYKNLYANEKDIYAQIKIFLNNITRYTTAIKGMFQYLFNSLNGTIRSFIIFLVVLILLSTILRFIRRG